MSVTARNLRVRTDGVQAAYLEHSDDDLLVAVAHDRCRKAFAELVRRYKRSMYNIARNITQSSALAEEAAQEAMLRVWLSASRFDPKGTARGWILCIVSREALKKVRDRKRADGREKQAAQQDPRLNANEDRSEERTELVGTLQDCIAELPELNRQLVSLYFGAGMTQAQIGASVDLSQRMVGYKIEETLKTLRARLAQAGLAVPALGGDLIAQAVCSGHPVPAGLGAELMGCIDTAVAAKGSAASVWVTASIMLAVTAAGGWFALRHASVGEDAPGVKVEETASVSAKPDPGKPFHRVWNFNDGPSNDFFAWANPWKWMREKDGVGRMIAKNGDPTNLLIDVHPPKRPFVIHFRAKGYASGIVRDNFFWTDGKTMPAYKAWMLPQILTHKSIIALYFFDRYIVHRTDGRTSLLNEFEKAYPGDQLCAVIANFRVEEIEMRELTEKEIADFAFDPRAEIARMEQLKAEVSHYKPLVFRGAKSTDAANKQAFAPLNPMGWYWDFKNGLPKDLMRIGDRIAWVPAKGNRKAEALLPLIKDSDMKRGFLLPVRVTEKPCVIEVWGRMTGPGTGEWGINLFKGHHYARARFWPMVLRDPEAKSRSWRMRCYLDGRKGITYSGSTVLSACRYPQDTVGMSFAVHGIKFAVQSISMRFIARKDLPDALRDERKWEGLLKRAVAPSYEVGLESEKEGKAGSR